MHAHILYNVPVTQYLYIYIFNLQCKGGQVPHERPKAIECCPTDMCNVDLHPVPSIRSTTHIPGMQQCACVVVYVVHEINVAFTLTLNAREAPIGTI